MSPRLVRSGVTRYVLLAGLYAVKVPRPRRHRRRVPRSGSSGVRGWLANRSEWRQRHRPGVNPPLLTVAHCVTVYRRADEVGTWHPGDDVPCRPAARGPGHDAEEAKGSSWGRFGDRWLLIDYDRAWERPHGIVGALYYAREDRRGRRWADGGAAR